MNITNSYVFPVYTECLIQPVRLVRITPFAAFMFKLLCEDRARRDNPLFYC